MKKGLISTLLVMAFAGQAWSYGGYKMVNISSTVRTLTNTANGMSQTAQPIRVTTLAGVTIRLNPINFKLSFPSGAGTVYYTVQSSSITITPSSMGGYYTGGLPIIDGPYDPYSALWLSGTTGTLLIDILECNKW